MAALGVVLLTVPALLATPSHAESIPSDSTTTTLPPLTVINGPATVSEEATNAPTPEQLWVAAISEIMLRDGVDVATANERLANLLRWHAAVMEIVIRDGVTPEVASHRLARLLASLAPRYGGDVERWYNTAIAAGWSHNQWPWVRCIIRRESGGNPGARSRTNDSGLMQINDVNVGFLRGKGIIASRWDLFDPLTNLIAAKALYDLSGTSPWRATRSNC